MLRMIACCRIASLPIHYTQASLVIVHCQKGPQRAAFNLAHHLVFWDSGIVSHRWKSGIDVVQVEEVLHGLVPQTWVKSLLMLSSIDVILHEICNIFSLSRTICVSTGWCRWKVLHRLMMFERDQVVPYSPWALYVVRRWGIINFKILNQAEEFRPSGMVIVGTTAMPANQKSILFMPPAGESAMWMGDRSFLITWSSSTSMASAPLLGVITPSGLASIVVTIAGVPWGGSSGKTFSAAAVASRRASWAAAYSSSAFAKPSLITFCFSRNLIFCCSYSSSTCFWNFCHPAVSWAISTFSLAAAFPEDSKRWLACFMTWGPVPKHFARYASTSGLGSCPRFFMWALRPVINPSTCLDGAGGVAFRVRSGALTPMVCKAEDCCQGEELGCPE